VGRRLAPLVLAASSLACIEDRLAVEIWTQVHADGSCSRRIEYRLERVDTDRDGVALEIPAAEDPFRLLHRFPSAEAWTVTREQIGRALAVNAEAALVGSPNDLDGDYWRARTPRGQPARNHVSFSQVEAGDLLHYDFAETFLDPASPTESVRALAQALVRREDEFAELWLRAAPAGSLGQAELRRAFREHLAQPFAREVEALASRPVHGPRERQDLEALFDRLGQRQAELLEALHAAAPESDPEQLRNTSDAVLEEMSGPIWKQISDAGLPAPFGLADETPARVTRIRFRATLQMPGPIVRANTCADGDTATWEFEQDDLYGRGFEMWARAEVPRPARPDR
jgi:hypothetical protein